MKQNQALPEEMGDLSFYGINDQGQQVKCDILVTFDVEDKGGDLHVVVYTDYSVDAEGQTKLYAAQYPDGIILQDMMDPPLQPLRDDLWGAVEEVLDDVFRQIRGE